MRWPWRRRPQKEFLDIIPEGGGDDIVHRVFSMVAARLDATVGSFPVQVAACIKVANSHTYAESAARGSQLATAYVVKTALEALSRNPAKPLQFFDGLVGDTRDAFDSAYKKMTEAHWPVPTVQEAYRVAHRRLIQLATALDMGEI